MKAELDPVVHFLRGGAGNFVYRKVRGKTIVSPKPVRNEGELSPAQMEHRERFKEAVAYGKGVMNSEDMREMYDEVAKKRDLPIFAVIMADFFNAPEIKGLDLEGYNGQAGSVFDIIVTDDFAVASVHVKIIDNQGNVVESGRATEASDGPIRWNYNATATITTDVTIEVVAKDWPGGVTVKQFQFAKPN